MKNKKLPVIVLFAFFIGIGIVNTKKPSTAEPSDTASQISETTKVKQKQTERTSNRSTTTPKMTRNITTLEFENFRDSLPTQEKMKNESQESPHFAPESLIKFAKQLGHLMEKALKNTMDAEIFSEELQDCAMDEAIVQSARATCVTSVERLAKRFPELKGKVEMIKANVAPDVKKLLKNRDNTLKR